MPVFAPLIDIRLLPGEEFSLRLGEEYRTGGLYYLGIDPRAPDYDCEPAIGLARLLASWMTHLCDPASPQPIYLPFDFADETTQWLACERSGNMLHAVFGWAPIEGWAISPSDFRQHARLLPDFTPNEPAFVQSFYLPRLLSDLRRQIGQLTRNQSGGNTE